MAEHDGSNHGDESWTTETTLIKKMQDCKEAGEKIISLGLNPPRKHTGVRDFKRSVRLMTETRKPLFCEMSWHHNGMPVCSGQQCVCSFCMAKVLLNDCKQETMLSLTCCGLTVENIKDCLEKAKSLGIRNILALRGDPATEGEPWRSTEGGLDLALDLVKLIRKEHKDYFVIAVAGFPEGHPDSSSYEEDRQHLKAKVDAGADFIITQMCFEADKTVSFVRDCRAFGITCPILPGFFQIQAYSSVERLKTMAGLALHEDILKGLESRKENPVALRKYGTEQAVASSRELLTSEDIPGLHIFTLNRVGPTNELLKSIIFPEN